MSEKTAPVCERCDGEGEIQFESGYGPCPGCTTPASPLAAELRSHQLEHVKCYPLPGSTCGCGVRAVEVLMDKAADRIEADAKRIAELEPWLRHDTDCYVHQGGPYKGPRRTKCDCGLAERALEGETNAPR